MNEVSLEEINEFYSAEEFRRFVGWVDSLENAGLAAEVAPRDRLLSPHVEEHWYYFPSLGQTWRLVFPDPPFKGQFSLVK